MPTLSSLSVPHLWQLGLLLLAHDLRPTYPIVVQSQEEYDAQVIDFFIPRLRFLADDREYAPIDVYHLAGGSCVIYNPVERHTWPTSTGQLIGGLYLDVRCGQTTDIYWG